MPSGQETHQARVVSFLKKNSDSVRNEFGSV